MLTVSKAIAAVSESETRFQRADSAGRQHTFAVKQYGNGGPVTRIEHRVDGELLAVTVFGWERVSGGWSLRTQRVAAYRAGDEASTTTVVVHQHSSLVATVKRSFKSSLLTLEGVFLPATVQAESVHGVEVIGDDDEGIALVGAGVLMGSMCIVGGPTNPFCLVAIAGYIYASNAWTTCRQQPE
jgi:hypothetical protein